MKKLVGLVLLIVSALVLSTTALADESGVVASGYCGGEGDGTNLTWTLTEDGTLTISGEGPMADYDCKLVMPDDYLITTADWGEYVGHLKSLEIKEGVTKIGWYAFYRCSGLTGNLVIPNSVTTIADTAFYGCSGFTGNLIIPDKVTTIGTYAFYKCGIDEYYFEGDAPHLGMDTFDSSDTIYYPAGNTTWIIENGKWKGYTAVEWNMNENEECEHVPAEAVKENEVKSTDGKDGSYDSVVYCSLCGEELRRETVSVAATGNHASNNQGGYNSSVVISIGKTESEQNPNTGAFAPSGIITVIMGDFILSFYKKRK